MINVMAEKTEPFNWVRISAETACDDLNIMPWVKAWNPCTISSAFPEIVINREIEMTNIFWFSTKDANTDVEIML